MMVNVKMQLIGKPNVWIWFMEDHSKMTARSQLPWPSSRMLVIVMPMLSWRRPMSKIVTIISNGRQYKIPDWFLNRKKDIIDGKYSQLTSSNVDWRRFELIVVCVTTGVSVSVVNTLRQLVVVDVLMVSPRKSKGWTLLLRILSREAQRDCHISVKTWSKWWRWSWQCN